MEEQSSVGLRKKLPKALKQLSKQHDFNFCMKWVYQVWASEPIFKTTLSIAKPGSDNGSL